MVSKKVIYTDKAPAPVGPYNQAIVAQGELVFLAGQIALNPQTGQIVGQGDIVAQTKQVMSNLEAVLKETGLTWANVVKTGVFLTDLQNFAPMNEIYGQYFEQDPPARACVEVSRLPKDVLVEIDCIAVK